MVMEHEFPNGKLPPIILRNPQAVKQVSERYPYL
eukprot:SAG31_NODE_11855_length_992_cov_0.856663_3_plen_33_part_01